MRTEPWQAFRRAAKREPALRIPVAAIVDSPWISGYPGAPHSD